MGECKATQQRLPAHHDGELPEDERLAVEAHLASCGRCAREAALLREALERARALPVPEPPAAFWEEFEAGVRRRITAERPPRRPAWERLGAWLHALALLRPVPVLAAATAVALLLAIGLIRAHRGPRDLPPPDLLAFSEDLGIGQNLEVLESLDLLEAMDVLERLDLLRHLEGTRRPRVS